MSSTHRPRTGRTHNSTINQVAEINWILTTPSLFTSYLMSLSRVYFITALDVECIYFPAMETFRSPREASTDIK